MPSRLIIARPVPPAVLDRARQEFDVRFLGDDATSPDALLAQLATHEAEALLLTGAVRLDAAMIASLPPSLRIAGSIGVGYDHIDVAAAEAHGLMVTNTPDVLTDCTADMAMLLLLAACRRGYEYEAIMRAGWRQKFGMPDKLGMRVSGQTLGIVGMGRIGRAMAQRARGFGMRILYHNRHRLPADLEAGAEYFPTLHAMLPQCRCLSLHAPGGAASENLIDAAALALLPEGAVLVNVARGTLVDEEALLAALTSGRLFAAGLDVFRNEPAFDRRFAALPNVFLTPHMGSATVETRDAMGFRALDNIAAVCAGRPAVDPLWGVA